MNCNLFIFRISEYDKYNSNLYHKYIILKINGFVCFLEKFQYVVILNYSLK